MDLKLVTQFITLILFIVSAYYIKESEKCPCPDADASRRNYILYFSYFEIAHLTIGLLLGNLFFKACLSFPVLFIIPTFALFGGLVWAIYTIQHVNSMKKCKCPDSIAQETTYALAIIRMIAWAILILLILYIVYLYLSFNEKDRKLFLSAFTKGFTQKIKNNAKN
jgi:Ni,Fe-hydrogenase I cytochrome b subunit